MTDEAREGSRRSRAGVARVVVSCLLWTIGGCAGDDGEAVDAGVIDAAVVADGGAIDGSLHDGSLHDGGARDAHVPHDGSARLLYRQDFEADGWEGDFTGRETWESHVAVVTHEPHGGSRSLRGNQSRDVTDPITGLPGLGNVLLDWRGSGHDIAARTPHEMYFSYWFRHDDFSYEASGEGKLLYFVDANGCSVREMYVAGQLHQRDLLIAYDNGCGSNRWAHCADSVHGAEVCGPCRAAGTCDNWGYSGLYLRHPEVRPEPGAWRHFEYHVDYDARQMRFWIDGHPVTDEERYPDGRIEYGPERTFHWEGFQIFYASTGDGRDYPGCVDGEGHCTGWQIDDLEVWDGLPDSRP